MMGKGMKHIDVEITRSEKVNEYGVKTVNRLIEHQKVFPDGKIYSKEYTWMQDMVQSDGDIFTHCIAHYKRFKTMQNCMEQYNFELKEVTR